MASSNFCSLVALANIKDGFVLLDRGPVVCLLQISGIEQELVCGNNSLTSHFETVTSLVNDSTINDNDRYAVRLALIHALQRHHTCEVYKAQ